MNEGVEPAIGQESDADCTDGYLVENIDEVSDASSGNFPEGESPIVLVGRSAIVVIPNAQCDPKHGDDKHPEPKLEVVQEGHADSDVRHGKTNRATPSSSVIVLRGKKSPCLVRVGSLGGTVPFITFPPVQS